MTFDADIANAAPEPLLVVQDERVVWANRAAEELLGAAPGGLRDRPLAELLAAGEPERLARLSEQRKQGWPLPDSCWVHFVHPDGHEIPADLRSAPFDHGV